MTRVCPSLRKNRLGRYAINKDDRTVKHKENHYTMSRVLQNDRGRCEVKKNQPAMLGNKEKILKNTYSITVPNDKSEDITITISDEDFRNMHALYAPAPPVMAKH